MKDTNAKSSKSTGRAPFQPITSLLQVPTALFEIRALAEEHKSGHIVPLIDSIITVTLQDPNAWAEVAKMRPVQEGNGK